MMSLRNSTEFLETLSEGIQAEYARQEEKFGEFWRDLSHWPDEFHADDRMISVLTEEYLELVMANNDDEGDERLEEEALHTAVVALRIVETIRRRMSEPVRSELTEEEQETLAQMRENMTVGGELTGEHDLSPKLWTEDDRVDRVSDSQPTYALTSEEREAMEASMDLDERLDRDNVATDSEKEYFRMHREVKGNVESRFNPDDAGNNSGPMTQCIKSTDIDQRPWSPDWRTNVVSVPTEVTRDPFEPPEAPEGYEWVLMPERPGGARHGGTYRSPGETGHYSSLNPEPIQVIRAWGLNFLEGSALKYLARYKKKGKPIQDLEKVEFYTGQLKEEQKRLGSGDG
jgi:hypothetical protein